MTRFATDLKSKHEGVRNKAAKDLYTYVIQIQPTDITKHSLT